MLVFLKFTLSLDLLHSLSTQPSRCFAFSKIFAFSKQWSHSTGHRDSSLDPGSSQQRLSPPGRRDRSWHPVIPHKRWTVDSPANHGDLYVRLSTRSGQLLSNGLTWVSPEFSRPHATATSNGERKTDHERYGEKSPYQAPDWCYYSNTVWFDSHISRWGKQGCFCSTTSNLLCRHFNEYVPLYVFKLPFVKAWQGVITQIVISRCWAFIYSDSYFDSFNLTHTFVSP